MALTDGQLRTLETEIKTSGFCLEYEATTILESHGWKCINNRYYIDDITENVREIDILAYRATESEKVRYYTTLMISCKKSEQNAWAFLTKYGNKDDVNFNSCPLYIWSNSKIHNNVILNEAWKEEYTSLIKGQPFWETIFSVDKKIFSFQEMKIKDGKCANDTNIYNAITTLIKAHDYEFANIQKRVKLDLYLYATYDNNRNTLSRVRLDRRCYP